MKTIITLLIAYTTIVSGLSGQSAGSVKTALLIVDIQEFYFPAPGVAALTGAGEAGRAAGEVLKAFRDNGQMVVHVKHNASRGADIHPSVAPEDGEKIIVKDAVNCFAGTDLHPYLMQSGVNRLVIIGMQTHMCLEAAVRAAHDFGFDCIVVEEACATRDLQYGDLTIPAEMVHASTLNTLIAGRYARVISLGSFLAETQMYLYK